jgi:hypothetical protein
LKPPVSLGGRHAALPTLVLGFSKGVCLAVELNPLYVDVAVSRWQAFTGKAAIREIDGLHFEDATPASIAAEGI